MTAVLRRSRSVTGLGFSDSGEVSDFSGSHFGSVLDRSGQGNI